MSEDEKKAVEYFVEWIKSGSLGQWLEHFLSAGDEPKLREIKIIYDKIKQIFGF